VGEKPSACSARNDNFRSHTRQGQGDQCSLEVEGALVVQQSQVAEDVGFDLFWLGFGIDLLQIGDDLLDGVRAVAALDDLETWAIQAEGAFGHEENALVLAVVAQAAARGETRVAIQVRRHG
jgi:hypothetical protein